MKAQNRLRLRLLDCKSGTGRKAGACRVFRENTYGFVKRGAVG